MNINGVSVIMSVYNESIDFLNQSVQSILNQTYEKFEFIIVCDNPENIEAIDYLEDMSKKDKRLVLIFNEKNLGLAESLNKAIKIAKFEIIMRMDADDISYSDRIATQLCYITTHKYDLVFSMYDKIDSESNILEVNQGYYSDEFIKRNLIYSNMLHHPTAVFKKSDVIKIGGYNDYPTSQDYDLWLRYLSQGKTISIVNSSLLAYRIQVNSVSNRKKMMQSYTTLYIRENYKNQFSKNQYLDYLRKKKVFDTKSNKKFNNDFNKLQSAKSKGKCLTFLTLIFLLFTQDYYRERLLEELKRILVK